MPVTSQQESKRGVSVLRRLYGEPTGIGCTVNVPCRTVSLSGTGPVAPRVACDSSTINLWKRSSGCVSSRASAQSRVRGADDHVVGAQASVEAPLLSLLRSLCEPWFTRMRRLGAQRLISSCHCPISVTGQDITVALSVSVRAPPGSAGARQPTRSGFGTSRLSQSAAYFAVVLLLEPNFFYLPPSPCRSTGGRSCPDPPRLGP